MSPMSEDLRYPVGKFKFPESVSDDERETMLGQIAETPARLREAIAGLDESQLATPYRRPAVGPFARWSITCRTAT